MHIGQVLHVGKESQWAFKVKEKEKSNDWLEPAVLNFCCRVRAFELPSHWGSKSETLKTQSWEGMHEICLAQMQRSESAVGLT